MLSFITGSAEMIPFEFSQLQRDDKLLLMPVQNDSPPSGYQLLNYLFHIPAPASPAATH
jgi:hypothetical protein